MENWINQIYIGLMTGTLGGIASGYIVYNYALEGLTFRVIIGTIILTLVIGALSIGLYILLFERKRNKMRTLTKAQKNHRYYATLTTAIAFLILTIQEGLRLFRAYNLNEEILSYEPFLFLILAIVTLGDYLLAQKWMPKK